MTHYMNLQPKPFFMIACKKKIFELRLYDEKRKLLAPNDLIIFSNTKSPEETLTVRVKKLHIFPSFDDLYKSLPLELCGYLPNELISASPKDMEEYYTPALQAQYGVVGIEIEVIKK